MTKAKEQTFLTLRLSRRDSERIERAAEKENRTKSNWCLTVLLAELDQRQEA